SDRASTGREQGGETLHPETIHGIVVVALFVVAALTALSLVELSGVIGTYLHLGMKVAFGWGRYVIPLYFVALGFLLLRQDHDRPIRGSFYIGLFLFLLSTSGLLHLFSGLGVDRLRDGNGGGFVGVFLSYPFQAIMGFWATLIVLLGLTVIAFLVMLNTSIVQLAGPGKGIGRLMGWGVDWSRSVWGRLWRRSDQTTLESGSGAESVESEQAGDPKFSQRVIVEGVSREPQAHEVGPIQETLDFVDKQPKRRKPRHIDIPLQILLANHQKPLSGNVEEYKEKIRRTLESFGIEVQMGAVNIGPTVTQYTFRPAEGVKLAQITTLQNDIALALAAHPIRVEAPIPGKSLVGIEVPNQTTALVRLREILESQDFRRSDHPLTFALGQDVAGKNQVTHLEEKPHLLIAGATGSGKSVMINALIVSLLYRNGPDDLKFILVDPKKVELSIYNGIPHLLTPVITEVEKTINALRWAVAEMDRRYQLLSETHRRNIMDYNQHAEAHLPYIVIVIDELADLMAVAAQDVEAAIIRLAQMARAVGIHLVLATQRPSVNVITGLIKANITSRIAFTVASSTDSRTILDFSGAEKLLGKGDMLYVSAELSKPRRIQGAFVTDQEISKVMMVLKAKAKPEYDQEVVERPRHSSLISARGFSDEDELLPEAKNVVIRAGKASASLLQRHLRVGYARAARLLDILEEYGIIGPADGSKPREILANDFDDAAGSSLPSGELQDLPQHPEEDSAEDISDVSEESEEGRDLAEDSDVPEDPSKLSS
ncbi:MAG: DNA translocase FtsK 4TM domain-containing protein, partial [Patescibacteria group bacterium]